MAFEKIPVTIGDISFDNVLNSVCERLWNKQTEHSLRRIREMDDELDELEKQLDELINAPFSTKMAPEK